MKVNSRSTVEATLVVLACALPVALAAYGRDGNASAMRAQSSAAQSSSAMHSMNFVGCVYQTSDDPTVFAIRRIPADMSASAAKPATTTTPDTTTDRNKPADTTAENARPRENATGTTGTAATPAKMGWYRLSSSSTNELEPYIGKAVRIMGTVQNAKDEPGADVVVREVGPNAVRITAIDLKPAPELKVQSITATQGNCNMSSTTR